MTLNVPLRLMSIMRSQSAGSRERRLRWATLMPAAQTKTSMAPIAPRADSTIAFTRARSVTSQGKSSAESSGISSSRRERSSFLPSLPTMVSRNQAWESDFATARPMPPEAPVMRADFGISVEPDHVKGNPRGNGAETGDALDQFGAGIADDFLPLLGGSERALAREGVEE